MTMHNFILYIGDKSFSMSTYEKFSSYFGSDARSVEPQTRNWFINNIKNSDIVFDVGANIGMYSILFSQYSNNTYCFEPTQTYDNFLKPNLDKNQIKNVKTFKLALSDKIGNFNENIFMIWGENPVHDNFNFTTLDDFSTKNNVIPNYIKIDVDGYDFEVLKGAKNLLLNNNIIVCVEINYALHTRGYKESDILNFMDEINYQNFLKLDNENYFFKKI
jgi:FkbM family methyltransferase